MPLPSVDYLNKRRELRRGSDHSAKRAVRYAPDYEPDSFESAMAHISAFSMWAETTRQVLVAKLGIPQTEPETEIPF